MKINKYKNIEDIEEQWKKCFNGNNCFTSFQSYEWNFYLQKKFKYFKNKVGRIVKGSKEVVFFLFTDNRDTIIAPLIISNSEKKVYIFGQQDMSDYLSFIFPNTVSGQFIHKVIVYLKNTYNEYCFCIDRVNESNKKMIEGCLLANPSEKVLKNCVKIPIIDDLINVINSDSRRYFNQARKRLITDNLSLQFSFENRKINSCDLRILLDHYNQRRINKFNISKLRSKIQHAKQFVFAKLGFEEDMVTLFIAKRCRTYLFRCIINGQLAAYIIGAIYMDTLYVLRISINDSLSEYRPGVLLIVESVKHVFDQEKEIKYLDFSRGDESYKLNYGGVIHHNYYFEF